MYNSEKVSAFSLFLFPEMNSFHKLRIISGGQTGADRAALDFALENKIACGGWCPSGRLAEDGKIPEKYPLKEASTVNYPQRTRLNIEDSDGTLIVYLNRFDPGTGLTLGLCKKLNKPFLIIKVSEPYNTSVLNDWIGKNEIQTLNIAGPRESGEPGIYDNTIRLLQQAFADAGK